MKKVFIKSIITASVFLLTLDLFSQQDAQYTQYMYNMNVLNPAYAGSKTGTLSASLLGRTQWVGIPGAPQTAVLSVHSPITERMGLGVSLLADKIGPINEQFLYADYSYTIPVGFYDNLAFGIKAGITLVNAKLTDLDLNEYGDVNFLNNINNLQPNFGFGVFYYSDIYYVGFSMPNLMSTTYLEKGGGFETKINKRNHMFLTGGYVFDMSYNWKFKPSIMAKGSLGAPISIDLSANFLFDETFEVGTSYRWGDALSLLLNAKVSDNLRVGYSYDFTTSELNKFSSGSHELIILFDLKTTYEIISPRFF
jgi:type IX secretion system PorP/SprF family membrane protein